MLRITKTAKTTRKSFSGKRWICLILVVFIGLSAGLYAQDKKAMINQAEKSQVIDSLSMHMEKDYVLAEIGGDIATLLRQNFKKGAYDKFDDPKSFAEQLTTDIRSINNDKHLSTMYRPEQIKQQRDAENESVEALEAIKRRKKLDNFGFKEIKILPGNIGYLKFNGFDGSEEGLKTAAGAMAFLRNSDALIFDLRENGGGDPRLVQLFISYLYDSDADIHINSFLTRDKDNTRQYWNTPYIPGEHMPDTDVYVLTSSYTFSCAEEFAYDLKNLKRATLIGETTGGGAHPVSSYPLNDNFVAIIPFGRAYNPISKTNWEGTGVEPDIKIEAAKALDKAQLIYLDMMLKKEQDKEFKSAYQWAFDGLNAKLNPVKLSEKLLKSYAGKYDNRTITMEKGKLFYQREGRPKLLMKPIKDDLFGFDEVQYFRLKVILKNGKPVMLEGHNESGMIDYSKRTD